MPHRKPLPGLVWLGMWAGVTFAWAEAPTEKLAPPPPTLAPRAIVAEDVRGTGIRDVPVIDTAPVRTLLVPHPSETPAERLQAASRSDQWLSDSLAALKKEPARLDQRPEAGRADRGPRGRLDRGEDRLGSQVRPGAPVPTNSVFSLSPRLDLRSRLAAPAPSPSPLPNPYLASPDPAPANANLPARPLPTPAPYPTPNQATPAQPSLSPIETGLTR